MSSLDFSQSGRYWENPLVIIEPNENRRQDLEMAVDGDVSHIYIYPPVGSVDIAYLMARQKKLFFEPFSDEETLIFVSEPSSKLPKIPRNAPSQSAVYLSAKHSTT